jgi:predicted transposase/invertase (TIGR01784 family)
MSYNFCHVQSQNAKTLTQGQKTTFHNTLFEMNFSRDRELLLDQWIYFLKHEEIQSEFTARGLQEAKEQLDVLKLPDAKRRAYEYYQDDLHQQASIIHSSYGFGLHKGRQEGLEEGLREAQLRIARSFLDVISDDQLIAEKTGLSIEEVWRLRETAGSGEGEPQ